MEPAGNDLWIAALAHHLARRWRTVDPDVLEGVAADIARDAGLRAMAPDEAAARWLEPVGRTRGEGRQRLDDAAVPHCEQPSDR